MKCTIKVMGVPDTSKLDGLRKRLVDGVNGGGNHVHIFPDTIAAELTGRVQCSCEVLGNFCDRDIPDIKRRVGNIVQESLALEEFPLVYIVEPRS